MLYTVQAFFLTPPPQNCVFSPTNFVKKALLISNDTQLGNPKGTPVSYLNFPEEIESGRGLNLLSMNEEYKGEHNEHNDRLPFQGYIGWLGIDLQPMDKYTHSVSATYIVYSISIDFSIWLLQN